MVVLGWCVVGSQTLLLLLLFCLFKNLVMILLSGWVMMVNLMSWDGGEYGYGQCLILGDGRWQ